MIYDLINPSDPITFEAPDLKIAALVTIVLGGGQYAAEPEDDGTEGVPVMMFGGGPEWWSAHFDEPLDGAGDRDGVRLAAALRSVCCANRVDRRLYDSALRAITDPAAREAFVAEWNDQKRSSMNDIMGRAHHVAAKLEAAAAKAGEAA